LVSQVFQESKGIGSRVKGLLNTSTKKAESLGFKNISAELYDVQNPFGEELRRSFDVFITDPVETIDGITLFLSRCVEGLRGEDSTGYFGLTHLESSRKNGTPYRSAF